MRRANNNNDEVLFWLDQNLVLSSNTHKQRNWNNIQWFSSVATLVPLHNQHCLVCFKAASRPESGAWLNSVPNNRVGIFIDNDTPHRRRYPRRTLHLFSSSIQMRDDCDVFGMHPLSFRFSVGRIPHHSALNDIVRHGLSAAGIPSMHKPLGLSCGDGKRPDGITVCPYSRGRCLIWDATCVNTYASTNLTRVALAAGSLADVAEVMKNSKETMLLRCFIFQPEAMETSGAI